jgi:hypothetical protein
MLLVLLSTTLHEEFSYCMLRKEIPGATSLYQDAGIFVQYKAALHWSMTQMAPGSVFLVPQNSGESCYNIICLFIGLMVSALLIS